MSSSFSSLPQVKSTPNVRSLPTGVWHPYFLVKLIYLAKLHTLHYFVSSFFDESFVTFCQSLKKVPSSCPGQVQCRSFPGQVIFILTCPMGRRSGKSSMNLTLAVCQMGQAIWELPVCRASCNLSFFQAMTLDKIPTLEIMKKSWVWCIKTIKCRSYMENKVIPNIGCKIYVLNCPPFVGFLFFLLIIWIQWNPHILHHQGQLKLVEKFGRF